MMTIEDYIRATIKDTGEPDTDELKAAVKTIGAFLIWHKTHIGDIRRDIESGRVADALLLVREDADYLARIMALDVDAAKRESLFFERVARRYTKLYADNAD